MNLIFIPILLLIIMGCSAEPHIIKQSDISVPSAQKVYIVNHGWHTGFVLPAETIKSQLPQLNARFKNAPFIEFGWGDKGFYQAKEITSGLTLRAIFWSTASVIHAVAVPESPDVYFSNSEIEALCLDANQYALLVSFIENSFYKKDNGNIIELDHGIYGNSQFYKGQGDYYLMNTCNKWTAKGLSSAKLDIVPTFKLTASSIMDYLSGHNNAQTGRSCGTNGDNAPLDPQR